MATNLEYQYQLKDQYSRKLAQIIKRQAQFTQAYAKSMGKVNGAMKSHQEILKRTAKVYNQQKQATCRSVESLRSLKRTQQDYKTQATKNLSSLIRQQADYNRLISQSVAQMNRLRPIRPGVGMGGVAGARKVMGLGAHISSVSGQINGLTNTVLGSIFNVRNAIMGLGTVYAGSTILKLPLGQASFFEDQLISMEVLLRGNKKRASELMKELQIMGAETPFEFKDLSKSMNMMLSFGAATEKNVLDKLRVLGDISQGDAQKLEQVSYAFSQIRAFGKLRGQERMQLVNAGVPLQELAKNMGMTMKRMDQLQAKGKITADMVEDALTKMTQKGGLFHDMMIKKSKTFSGLVSTLKDNINLTAMALGQTFLPLAKRVVIKLTKITEKIRAWADENKNLIGLKMQEWFYKLKAGYKWVVDNSESIVFWTKALIASLIALKGLQMATSFILFAKEVLTAGRAVKGLIAKIWALVVAKKALNATDAGGAGRYIPGVGGGGPGGAVGRAGRAGGPGFFGKLWGMIKGGGGLIAGFLGKIVAGLGVAGSAILGAVTATVASAIMLGKNMADTQHMAKEINKLTTMRNADMSQEQRNFAMNRVRMLGMMRSMGMSSPEMEMPKKAVDMRNYVEARPLKANVDGNIKVQAEEGSRVTEQFFNFNVGNNMNFGGAT